LKKKQDIADKLLSPLAQKMTDVFIVLRQFWSRRVFFDMQALPKSLVEMKEDTLLTPS